MRSVPNRYLEEKKGMSLSYETKHHYTMGKVITLVINTNHNGFVCAN